MKKIVSALISITIALCAVPVVSNAENTDMKPLHYTISDNNVIFDSDKSYDFVTVVAPNSEFTTERTDDTFTFTPTTEQDGKYIVSRVWLEETTLYYPIRVWYDLMEGIDVPSVDGYLTGECKYSYPHIQNFEITYNAETGIKVEFLGERSYTDNASHIASGEMGYCPEFTEIQTDDVFNNADYYILASGIGEGTFIYFDYADENKKDKSVLCIKNRYFSDIGEDNDIVISGNAEKTKSFCGGSEISGDLMESTCDIVSYRLIEPTDDGMAEIWYDFNYYNPCDLYIPPVIMILNIENGQFIPNIETIGDDFIFGDMNFDYNVNIADAVIMQKYMLGKTKLTKTQYNCADLNSDGIVDIFDMVLFRQEIINSK